MNQAQEIRLMMQKAQNTCPEGSIEQSDCNFEIELLGNLYRTDQFKERRWSLNPIIVQRTQDYIVSRRIARVHEANP